MFSLSLKRRYFLLLLIIKFIHVPTFAQKEGYRGIFGNNLELNFNVSPVEVSILPFDNFYGNEGVATISDRNGNLLFYTNGETVWNNTFHVMPNGSSINGPPYGMFSTSQSAIVPIPKDPFLYYIFTIGAQGGDLKFSLVDMRRDGGLGDVVFMDSLLYRNSTEKVYAVKNAAGDGIWVITHEFGTNVFRTFTVSENGLDTNSVQSAVGEAHPLDTIVENGTKIFGTGAQGYLEASPDGSKLACAVGGPHSFLEIFDFDINTGIVSNPVKIYDAPQAHYIYGVEFSPDGSKLYSSIVDSNAVYQYDLNAGNTQDIINSSVLVSNAGFSSMQLAPDGKIYVVTGDPRYLDVINNPNGKGLFCDYEEHGIYLLGKTAELGLPEFTFPIIPPDIIYNKWCNGDSVRFDLYKASHVVQALWDFGDPDSGPANQSTDLSPLHIFSKPGTYNIRADLLLDFNNNNTITYEKTITIFETPQVYLGKDTFICNQGMIDIWAPPLDSGIQHLWMDRYLGDQFEADHTGNYWIKVYTDYCYNRDTIYVGARNTPYFNLNDTTLCFNQDLPVHLSYPYTTFTWNDGYKGSDRVLENPGVYSVTGYAGFCGSYTDSLYLYILPRLHADLGKDTTLCQNAQIDLNVQNDSASYLWNDHSTNPFYTIYSGGTYWVEIKNRCESVSDTLHVHMFEMYDVFLPNLVTPNKDAHNDTFILNIPTNDISMSFVNRWGEEVYHSERYGNDWPDEDISPGVYFYFIKEKCSNREFKGWVDVIK